MVKPGFSHFYMEKWHITIATRIPPRKKLHPMAQTDGHDDSMTNSAQRGRVGENLWQ